MNRTEKLLLACTALIVSTQLAGSWWVARAVERAGPYDYSRQLEEIQQLLGKPPPAYMPPALFDAGPPHQDDLP